MLSERKKTAPLGKILLQLKKITFAQLGQALIVQKEKMPDKRIGEILVYLSFISEDELAYALALQYQYPSLDLKNYSINQEALALISKETAEKNLILPLDIFDDILTVTVLNPLHRDVFDEISKNTGKELRLFVSSRQDILSVINTLYK
jgi:type IV pilus assembly protein PilB